MKPAEHERAREIGDRLGEIEVLEEKLRINHKIRAYVAFVLTGDEKADVQLAADNAKQALQGLADALRKSSDIAMQSAWYGYEIRQDYIKKVLKQARAALDAARPFLEGPRPLSEEQQHENHQDGTK